jgi:hypothetical protein
MGESPNTELATLPGSCVTCVIGDPPMTELTMTSVTDDTERLLPIKELATGTSVACERTELATTCGKLVICVSPGPPKIELITLADASARDDTGR